ncbi:MAG: hypothetical protein Q8O67_02065 [Deltaproteobacteria bacterium]|nr:hypothetical protein [Deltaproteobacteria bacterium]
MRTNVVLAACLLATVAVGGCQCINDDNFQQLKDAGFPEVDAGPPPPLFPLKPGDVLTIPQFGGRVDVCNGPGCACGGQSGDCDRNVKATYEIKAVQLNDENRWEITADVLYEGLVDNIPPAALSRLAIENGADFGAISSASPVVARDAIFTTDQAPRLDNQYVANNFPFFQGENDLNDGDEGEVFAAAAAEFTEAILAIDEQAEVETQVSVGKLEAYFKDELNGPASVHKLLVEVHPMGFVCGWDEILVPFVDDVSTPRNQSVFNGFKNPPLTAAFFQPNLIRDGVTYQCSCFNATCRNGTTCLDPTDPDAPPGACP